jgi:hypothetical protein
MVCSSDVYTANKARLSGVDLLRQRGSTPISRVELERGHDVHARAISVVSTAKFSSHGNSLPMTNGMEITKIFLRKFASLRRFDSFPSLSLSFLGTANNEKNDGDDHI